MNVGMPASIRPETRRAPRLVRDGARSGCERRVSFRVSGRGSAPLAVSPKCSHATVSPPDTSKCILRSTKGILSRDFMQPLTILLDMLLAASICLAGGMATFSIVSRLSRI